MGEYTEAFVGIDAAKARNAIAVAEGGRGGEIRYLGEVDAAEQGMRRLVARLAAKYDRVHFCYEAGPTGYGLYRLITRLGYECTVVAPSLVPRKPGDRVKTNRRDAVALARLLRAGELTPVWVPDEDHEAIRDLVRARAAAVETLRVHKQQVSAFMLKHGRHFPRKATWGARYLRWLQEQKFAHPAHQIVLQEAVEAVRLAKERVERLERLIEALVPTWSLAPIVTALQALRGVNLIVAVTFVAEIGDLRRFESPRHLMAYLGLVPSERSRPARRHHQGGQRPCPASAGGERLDLPPSPAGRGEEARQAGARAAQGPRDRLEGTEPPDRAVPGPGRPRQEADHRLHRDRPRARRVHVVHRPGEPARMIGSVA
jgi:transposase